MHVQDEAIKKVLAAVEGAIALADNPNHYQRQTSNAAVTDNDAVVAVQMLRREVRGRASGATCR